MSAPAFLVAAPSIEIRDGIAFIDVEGRPVCCMALSTLRATYRRAGAVLAMHDAAPENVVPLRKRGAKH